MLVPGLVSAVSYHCWQVQGTSVQLPVVKPPLGTRQFHFRWQVTMIGYHADPQPLAGHCRGEAPHVATTDSPHGRALLQASRCFCANGHGATIPFCPGFPPQASPRPGDVFRRLAIPWFRLVTPPRARHPLGGVSHCGTTPCVRFAKLLQEDRCLGAAARGGTTL